MRAPIYLSSLLIFLVSCQWQNESNASLPSSQRPPVETISESQKQSKNYRLAKAAESIINPKIVYDPKYVVLDYPNGDVPPQTGVCTDVVVRSFRKIGIDLQKEVHEDMAKNFSKYPKKWGRNAPDRNIDHRRVPNLMTYFERKGYAESVTQQANNYQPGDIVSWVLDNGMTHIGIVSTQRSEDGKRFQMVHNIGGGQVLEDCLFSYTITGHYRL